MLLFAQSLLLLTPCLGLSILGGVPRIGTLNINGDPVITTDALTLPTRISSGLELTENSSSRMTSTNWSNRGMYINRDISRSSVAMASSSTATSKINLLDRPTNTPLYCLIVTLQVKPECQSDFLSCISNNQYHTLTSEPNAITYIYGQDTTLPNTYHFFEQYTNGKDGFIEHTQTKHFRNGKNLLLLIHSRHPHVYNSSWRIFLQLQLQQWVVVTLVVKHEQQ
jgi:quinol monooxygenase YgiN